MHKQTINLPPVNDDRRVTRFFGSFRAPSAGKSCNTSCIMTITHTHTATCQSLNDILSNSFVFHCNGMAVFQLNLDLPVSFSFLPLLDMERLGMSGRFNRREMPFLSPNQSSRTLMGTQFTDINQCSGNIFSPSTSGPLTGRALPPCYPGFLKELSQDRCQKQA